MMGLLELPQKMMIIALCLAFTMILVSIFDSDKDIKNVFIEVLALAIFIILLIWGGYFV